MKKFTLVTCMMLAVSSLGVWAGPVDEATAFDKAKAFLLSRGSSMTLQQTRSHRAPAQQGNGTTVSPFYVFNSEDGHGFVLVSGDTRGESILGYSEEGSLDLDNLPPALQMQLDFYAEQINMLDESQTSEEASPRRSMSLTREYVAPFLKTKWGQGFPYNKFCPTDPSNPSITCPTGCVNTAFAQALACFPGSFDRIEAIPGYTSYTDMGAVGQQLEDLDPYDMDWSLIKETYTATDEAGHDAVASLMQRCAWSTETSFKATESGGSTSFIKKAMRDYFHFADDVRSIHVTGARDIEASIEEIYNEMSHHRPVIVGASAYATQTTSTVGHAYLIGGYDRDDYFYINWGWGGSADGWFRFSAMSEYDAPVYMNFSFSIYCVTGIQPANHVESNDVDYYQAEDKSLQYVGTKMADDGSTVTIYNCNMYPTEETFEQALGAFDKDFNLKAVIRKHETTYPAGVYTELPVLPKPRQGEEVTDEDKEVKNVRIENVYTIPSKVTAGMRLLPVSRIKGCTEWHYDRCACDTAYFEMTANGLQAVPSYEVLGFAPNEADMNQPAGAPVDMVLKIRNNALNPQTLQMRLAASSTSSQHAALTYSEELKILPHSSEVDLVFPFVQYSSDTYKTDLWIYREAASGIGSSAQGKCNVTIGGKKTYWSTAADRYLKFEIVDESILDGDGTNNKTKTYSDKYYIKFKVKNTGSEPYNDYMRFICTQSGKWMKTQLYHLRLQAGEEKEFEYYVDNLKFGTQVFVFVAAKNVSTSNWDAKGSDFKDYEYLLKRIFKPTQSGVRYWDASGRGMGVEYAASFETPENALAVMTTDSKKDVVITPNSNPNTVYYVKNANEAASLEGKNVVMMDGDAFSANSDITFTDGQAAFVPQEFNLNGHTASYVRTFDKGNMGADDSNWNTVVFPFAPSAVKAGEEALDWFRDKTEEDKNIWMGYFYGAEYNKVYFKMPQELLANKPYIITVAGDKWGEEWNLVGKKITFSQDGSDYVVPATPKEIFNEARDLCFLATTTGVNLKESVYNCLYFMNEAGNQFDYVKGSKEVEPFRSFFASRTDASSVSTTTSSVQVVFLDDNSTSAIRDQFIANGAGESEVVNIYTLSGVKVMSTSQRHLENVVNSLPKGLYIINGKKIIK